MLTGTYFYKFDTRSKPGKVLAYGVRFEMVEIEAEGFETTGFNLMCDQFPELQPFDLRAFRGSALANFAP